jgi:flagellar hook-associated protein 1 FlgK
MTSLGSILQTGRSALLAQQAAIANASANTANAETIGYARRDVTFTALPGQSGVGISAIMRRTAPLLEQRLVLQRGRLGAHEAKSEGLSGIERMFAESEHGLGARLDAFFGSLRMLASSPTDGQLRRDVIARGQDLANSFQSAADGIDRERTQADAAIVQDVAHASELIAAIAQQNAAVTATTPGTPDHASHLDQRALLVDQLSELCEVTTIAEGDGSLTILLAGGPALVQGDQAASLRSSYDPLIGGLHRVQLVDVSGAALDVTTSLRGGSIGGRLELRDEILVDTGDRLDQLAYDIATAMNGQHQAGFGTDGLGGRDFFAAPGGVAGTARTLALTAGLADNPEWLAAAGSAATAMGGNDNVLALAGLADLSLANGGTSTFVGELAGLVGDLGRAARSEADAVASTELALEQTRALHQSSTGVSIDEELIDITRFERAYQAGARIIQTADRMYEALLQL